MRISDWSSDVCSSDLLQIGYDRLAGRMAEPVPLADDPALLVERGDPEAVGLPIEVYPAEIVFLGEVPRAVVHGVAVVDRKGVELVAGAGVVDVAGRLAVGKGKRPVEGGRGDRKSTRLNSSH